MKQIKALILTAITGVCALTSASAYNESEWNCSWNSCCNDFIRDPYISPKIGFNYHNDVTFKDDTGSTKTLFQPGVTTSLSMGFHVWKCFRTEVEGIFSYNRVKREEDSGFSPSNIPASGHVRDILVMFNAFYDYQLTERWSLYLGAGAGIDFYERVATNNIAGTAQSTHNGFAFQFMPGFAFNMTDRLDLILGYRIIFTEKQYSSSGLKSTDRPYISLGEIGLRFKL